MSYTMNLGGMLKEANEYFKQKENKTSSSLPDFNEIKKIAGMTMEVFFVVLITQLVLWIWSIILAARSGSGVMIALAVFLPFIIPVPLLVSVVMIIVLMNSKKPSFGYPFPYTSS